MFKKLAIWLIIHSRSTGFQKNLTVSRLRSTARSTIPNRELGAVSRSTARSPDIGSGRPDNVHTCTHPTVRTAVTARSTVLTCNRAGRPSGRPQQVKTEILRKLFLKICLFSKNEFCQDFVKDNKLSLQILK